MYGRPKLTIFGTKAEHWVIQAVNVNDAYEYADITLVGYVDEDGCITGWLNELAFVPVDANPDAMIDEWAGDIGCGVKYYSQDGVIKLAPRAGIELDESASPAEKLKVIQKLNAEGDKLANEIYENIGVY